MKKTALCLLLGIVIISSLPARAFANDFKDYWKAMGHDFWRGFKNVISAPAEIPISIQKAHESAGRPVVRHMRGVIEGISRMVERAGSGLWDFLVGWVPGAQEGVPPKPETLF